MQYLVYCIKADFNSSLQVVASKFLNDEGEEDEIFNDEWAEAGMCVLSLRLEMQLLNKSRMTVKC